MPTILLINPNTSESTTSRMVAIAQAAAPAGTTVIGATARAGVAMITDEASLRASVSEVIALGVAAAGDVDGMIVAAFGDPGLADLRGRVTVPVVGIAESAMHAAAAGGRRFGIATVTPGLAGAITARATALGLQACFTGLRLTEGDPLALVAEPAQLLAALAAAVTLCIEQDGAEAVVIGGGPLGDAAAALTPRFTVPIIAPIPAAMRSLEAQLAQIG